MTRLKGITVKLLIPTGAEYDGFNHKVETAVEVVEVKNVLVAPASLADTPDAVNLERSKTIYHIAIPKTDTHDWSDKTVEFYGKKWKVVGEPKKVMPNLAPLDWNDIWTVTLIE